MNDFRHVLISKSALICIKIALKSKNYTETTNIHARLQKTVLYDPLYLICRKICIVFKFFFVIEDIFKLRIYIASSCLDIDVTFFICLLKSI